jgi:hypothetical protein
MNIQPFGEESASHTPVFEWYDWFRADKKKKGKPDEEQSQEHAYHFL